MSMDLLLTSSAVTAAIYLILIGIVALIASAHSDKERRADAAKVLDRLLRRARR